MPERTRELLATLRGLGMTDETFMPLHHLGTDMHDHDDYCSKRTRFQSGGTNEDVRQRLEMVLREVRRMQKRGAIDWEAAGSAALLALPLQ